MRASPILPRLHPHPLLSSSSMAAMAAIAARFCCSSSSCSIAWSNPSRNPSLHALRRNRKPPLRNPSHSTFSPTNHNYIALIHSHFNRLEQLRHSSQVARASAALDVLLLSTSRNQPEAASLLQLINWQVWLILLVKPSSPLLLRVWCSSIGNCERGVHCRSVLDECV